MKGGNKILRIFRQGIWWNLFKKHFMGKQVSCDLCTAAMTLQTTLSTKKKFKVRRYKCSICGYEKSVFGSGFADEVLTPIQAKQSVDKMYKQQERNN